MTMLEFIEIDGRTFILSVKFTVFCMTIALIGMVFLCWKNARRIDKLERAINREQPK